MVLISKTFPWFFLRISMSLLTLPICSCLLKKKKIVTILIIIWEIFGLIIPTFLPYLTLVLMLVQFLQAAIFFFFSFSMPFSANSGDARDMGSIPGLGRSPREGNGNPHQYSCLELYMHREDWRATIHEATESDTTEHTHTPLLIFCWKVNMLSWVSRTGVMNL